MEPETILDPRPYLLYIILMAKKQASKKRKPLITWRSYEPFKMTVAVSAASASLLILFAMLATR